MRPKTYELEEIARLLAFQGHFSKHKKTFEKHLGIKDSLSLEKHIISVLKDKNTLVFQGADTRDIYYHEKSNTFISVDLLNKQGGSCFLPLTSKEKPKGTKYFVGEIINDVDFRREKNHKIKTVSAKKGDFDALYAGKKINKRAKIKYAKKAAVIGENKKRHDYIRQKRAEAKIEKDRKKAQIATLQKKKEQEAKIQLENKKRKEQENKLKHEAEKNKQSALAKFQQAKNDLTKEQARKDELKRKQEKVLQEELERQRQREARLKALEEARKRALEASFSINKNDITKKF